MNFFDVTSIWIKGEIFEARLIFIFGMSVIILGIASWKFGTTPNAKALVIPLLIIGAVYTALGSGMYFSNHKRMPSYQQVFNRDKQAFVQAEKKRVEQFQYMYVVSKVVATVFFLATLLIFWLSRNQTMQGWGIGLAVFAIAGLLVDYFSQERAGIYYHAILKALH